MNNDLGIAIVLQKVLFTLYELKKDILFLQYLHIQDANIPKSKDEAIKSACDFVLNIFPGFNIPDEAFKFYQDGVRRRIL